MSEYFSSDFEPFGVFEFADQEPVTSLVYDSMRDALGPAFQQEAQDAETFADAMCIGVAQLQLEAAGAQDDPDQISYLIGDVEKDYQIVPTYGATLEERRAVLKSAMTAAHGALVSVVFEGLEALLGDDFIDWRPTDFDTEVSLATLTPEFSSVATPIKVVSFDTMIVPGANTVSYTRLLDEGNALKTGEIVTVEPGRPGLTERVQLASADITGLFFFPHDAGVMATTAPQPLWVSTKCHGIVVVRSSVLDNPTQVAAIHLFMRKCMPAFVTWCITDPEPSLSDEFLRLMVPSTLRVGQTVLAAPGEAVPIDVADYVTVPAPLAAWSMADAAVTDSDIAQIYGTELALWTRTGIGVVTDTTGPVDGATGVQFMQDASTGPHAIDIGWTGTALTTTSIVVEIVAKIIGAGVYLWFRDAWDSVPIYKTDGSVIAVVAGSNATAWTLDMQDYGSGWYKYRLIARGLWHTPTDPDYAVEILMGTSSDYLTVVGDVNKGMIISSVVTYQYSELDTVPDSGALGADLTANVTYVPEYRQSGFIAKPDMWSPNGQIGIAATTDATVLALYDTSSVSTTAVNFGVYEVPSGATSIVLSRTDGVSFSFGLQTTLALWCGIYGATYFTTVDAVPLGEHRLTVVKNGTEASVYLDGELFCAPATVDSATPDAFELVTMYDSGIGEARIWDSVLTDEQILRDAREYNTHLPLAFPDERMIWNGSLWDTRNVERLAFSESKWIPIGSPTSIDLEYWDAFGAIATGDDYGPTVLADGVVIDTITLTGTSGLHTENIVIPAGTQELIVRNGPRGDNPWHAFGTKVTIAGGATRVMPVAPAHRLVIVGDSVANGFNSTVPGVDGWAPQLKTARTDGGVTVYGRGGYAFADEAGVLGWDTEFPARIAALCDGTSSNDIVFALCINDAMGGGWGGGGGAAGYGTAVGILIDAIHALLPNAWVWLWGPHTCTNALGSAEATVAPFRAALLAEETGRTAWCTAIDASAWTVAMDDTDASHLHPSSTGHGQLFTNMQTALSWT